MDEAGELDVETLHAARHLVSITPKPTDEQARSGYSCYTPKRDCIKATERLAAEYNRLARRLREDAP